MSVDEMISWIADRDHLHDGPKIMAALRAAEQLHKNLSTCYYADCIDAPALMLDNIQESLEAFNDATKGE
jgi:hypothetical protein